MIPRKVLVAESHMNFRTCDLKLLGKISSYDPSLGKRLRISPTFGRDGMNSKDNSVSRNRLSTLSLSIFAFERAKINRASARIQALDDQILHDGWSNRLLRRHNIQQTTYSFRPHSIPVDSLTSLLTTHPRLMSHTLNILLFSLLKGIASSHIQSREPINLILTSTNRHRSVSFSRGNIIRYLSPHQPSHTSIY